MIHNNAISIPYNCSFYFQTNGLDELFNQTLQNMLVKFVSSSLLFELMFNRQACLTIDVEVSSTPPKQAIQEYHQMPDPDLSLVHAHHQEVLGLAKTSILKAQEKQKEQNDKKHAKPERYKAGQLMLKLDFLRKKTKGGKLKERYTGPYKIISVQPRGVYEVSDGK